MTRRRSEGGEGKMEEKGRRMRKHREKEKDGRRKGEERDGVGR